MNKAKIRFLFSYQVILRVIVLCPVEGAYLPDICFNQRYATANPMSNIFLPRVGQQKKVAIIRTLVKQPSIILADEPAGSADDETAEEILEYLRYLKNEKKLTVIVPTHGAVPDTFACGFITIENGDRKSVV